MCERERDKARKLPPVTTQKQERTRISGNDNPLNTAGTLAMLLAGGFSSAANVLSRPG